MIMPGPPELGTAQKPQIKSRSEGEKGCKNVRIMIKNDNWD